MSDPVAARSAAIAEHMNKDHLDSVKALVQYHAKLDRLPYKARFLSIDSRGVTIEFQRLTSFFSSPRPEKARIGFEKPLASDSEARPAIIALAKEAEASRPKKYTILYKPNADVFVFAGLFSLWLVLRTPALRDAVPSISDPVLKLLGNKYERFDKFLSLIWTIHVGEAVATSVMTIYRGATLPVILQYAVSTVLAGFTQPLNFHKLNP